MRLAFLSIGRHIHTERWIHWFVDQGHECHLLTVQPSDLEGVTVHDIRSGSGAKPFRYLASLRRVRSILKSLQPDLLNTHFLTGYGYWGHFSGMHPNVLTVWGDDVYVTPFENPLKRWLAQQALGSCDALTGDSADILEVSATLGAKPTQCYRVLWGVDFEVFRPGQELAWRQNLGFADDDIVYFSPRSYTQPYYNIDVVIAAAARVKAEEPRARFLFSGYEGDPAPFEAKARTAGIAEVMAMVGRMAHEEFAVAMRAADVFISVPSVDATAVSLLEAMSSGTAVIVSSLASSLEWISHDDSGVVVAPRDEDALVAAMLRLGRDEDFRQACAARALQRAHEAVGFAKNMGIVTALFDHLVKAEPQPTGTRLVDLRQGSGR